jgi:class 3 adenylate cyclase/predicted ATPase
VTILFADVKQSMDLAEQVDPEEWHRILDRFFQILADGVHRFEGTINQYTGDGIMALFGAPIAHEDHAQRACYAALRLSEELRRYADELRRTKGLNFSVRLGLNSGEVVVGKIGDDLRMDYTAQGHTVGLAQRVEQLAEPGHAYLSQHTARLVEGFFQLLDLGESKVAGASEPLRVYDLQGVGPMRTRLEASARRGLVRFVGRQRELEQLQRAWEAAQAGRGQIVAVLGEAGVGKSRLVYEFKGHLKSGCRVLDGFSVSHGKAYAYLPLLELLKGYFRITIEDDEGRRQEKVTGTVLTLDRTLEDTLPYLFSLLGIAGDTSPLAQMDPQIRRQRTLEAVKRVLMRETLRQPCVLVFEDLHWIDSETQAFLDVLVDSVATVRLLLLVNYRPEYQHGWGSRTCYTRLRLDPFGPEEARELLRALLGEGTGEEREALDRLILSKTQGNPFFLEELVQTLVEEGVLTGEPGHYRLKRSPGELHIPATVQGVIGARIDRLPSREKDLLQTLAVIGKEFSLGLIRAVAGESEGELSRGLSHLRAAEFIYERPAFPDPEYTFKHALTQEVAYGSLLKERRGVLHERTGQAIEALNPQGLEAHYEELAHHYGRSANTPKAVEYLRLAGQQAVARSAYEEATGRLRQALELLKTLPETRERDELELVLQPTLGEALVVTEGHTSVETEQAYVRARALAERLGNASQLFAALNGLRAVQMARAEHDRSRLLAEELLRLARRTGDPAQRLWALNPMGGTSYWQGKFCEAREHLEELLGLYDPKKHRGHDNVAASANVGVWGLFYFSYTLLSLGYPDQALTKARQALALARDLSHPFSEGTALTGLSRVYLDRGESKTCLETAEALINLSSEQGFPYYLAVGALIRAAALAEEGDPQQGIAGMRSVLEGLRARGAVLGSSHYLATLAAAHRKAGQVGEGLAVVAEGLEFVSKTSEHWAEAELHRVKGDLLLARTPADPAGAEASFRDALEVARRQSAKSLELRSATSLARLWQQQGRKDEAHELLAPVYDWFTEGFDTRDLKEAKVLLEELA